MHFRRKFENKDRARTSCYNARSRNIPETMQEAHGTSVTRRCMLHHRAVAWVWVKLCVYARTHIPRPSIKRTKKDEQSDEQREARERSAKDRPLPAMMFPE